MINLPHGGPGSGFDEKELVKHIREKLRSNYIVQGQQPVPAAKHTKRHSLDYWLRQFAKHQDTKQAVNSVCDALVATGLFKISKKPDPVTGRLVKVLCIAHRAEGMTMALTREQLDLLHKALLRVDGKTMCPEWAPARQQALSEALQALQAELRERVGQGDD